MRLINVIKRMRDNEETNAIALLLLFSFFMGIALTFFFTVSISSFLTNFSGESLPYAYLLSGLLSYLIWMIYQRLSAQIHFSKLLVAILIFLFLSVALLTLLNSVEVGTWLSMLLLGWVSPFMFVKNVSFWGMASKLFNISQGKRLFGIISSGEVISNIIGFFSVPFLLKALPPSGLLVISMIALFTCITLTLFIVRKHAHAFSVLELNSKGGSVNDTNQSYTKKDNFFYLIIVFALLPVFVFYFVDYIFLNLADAQYENDQLASFMGYFLGAVSIAELLFKSIGFSRILKYYGLRVGLLFLSVSLLLSTLLAIASGIWFAAFLFSMVALSKLLERSLSNGIHSPSMQIIYQPIPSSIRMKFQSNVEGIASAFGNMVAGGVLLLISIFSVSDPLVFCYILLVVLSLWIFITDPVYKMYARKLQEALHSKRDRQPARRLIISKEIFERGLQSKTPQIIAASAKLLTEVETRESELVRSTEDPAYKTMLTKLSGSSLEIASSLTKESEAVNYLESIFLKTESSAVKSKILEVYFRIDSEKSKQVLFEKLDFPNREVQMLTIRLLYSLKYKSGEKEASTIRQKITDSVGMITWLNASLVDLGDNDSVIELVRALRTERKEYFNALYMLLSFAYGYATVDLIKSNLFDRSDTESNIYALEVAANTFDADVMAIIAPWFENASLERSLDKISQFFPQQKLSPENRAINILYKDYSKVTHWTKVNALNFLSSVYHKAEPRNEIIACLFHESLIIREVALRILMDRDANEIAARARHSETFKIVGAGKLPQSILYDRVRLLKNTPLFHGSPEYKLIAVASLFEPKTIIENDRIPVKDDCVILISGSLEFYNRKNLVARSQPSYTFIQEINPVIHIDYFVAASDSMILIGLKESVMNYLVEDPYLAKHLLKYMSENIDQEVGDSRSSN